jgi:hypothetical protein
MRLSSRVVLIGSAVLAFLILVFGLGGVLLGREILVKRTDTPAVRQIARFTHFPVARVGSRWITYFEYLSQTDAQRQYLQGKEAKALGMAGAPTLQMQQSIYDQLVRMAAIEDLAQKNGFEVTSLDVNRAYDELINQAGTSTQPGEVQAYLKENFGWDETEFKKYIVRPALLKNGMIEKRKKDTGKDDTFETEVDVRLNEGDVSRWLRFE